MLVIVGQDNQDFISKKSPKAGLSPTFGDDSFCFYSILFRTLSA